MYKKIRHFIGKRYNAFRWQLNEGKLLRKHLGSSDIKETKQKFKANIIIQSHIIEKGLSLNDVKIGFGESKIKRLMDDLEEYYFIYKDVDFFSEIMYIIDSYFVFNKSHGHENKELIDRYQSLFDDIKPDFSNTPKGGVKEVTKEDILSKALIDFEGFVNTRYSIRHFSGEPVDIDLVKRALIMSQKTPSACNRQPWKAHLMTNKNTVVEFLDYQTGARQFKNEIECAILVTSTYNSFFGGEFHQPYVNGGLFAMTLMYALHSVGLGTIPLNMGFEYSKLKKISKIIDIGEDEVPIVLIAIGNLPDKFKVASSNRFSFEEYVKIY